MPTLLKTVHRLPLGQTYPTQIFSLIFTRCLNLETYSTIVYGQKWGTCHWAKTLDFFAGATHFELVSRVHHLLRIFENKGNILYLHSHYVLSHEGLFPSMPNKLLQFLLERQIFISQKLIFNLRFQITRLNGFIVGFKSLVRHQQFLKDGVLGLEMTTSISRLFTWSRRNIQTWKAHIFISEKLFFFFKWGLSSITREHFLRKIGEFRANDWLFFGAG